MTIRSLMILIFGIGFFAGINVKRVQSYVDSEFEFSKSDTNLYIDSCNNIAFDTTISIGKYTGIGKYAGKSSKGNESICIGSLCHMLFKDSIKTREK